MYEFNESGKPNRKNHAICNNMVPTRKKQNLKYIYRGGLYVGQNANN